MAKKPAKKAAKKAPAKKAAPVKAAAPVEPEVKAAPKPVKKPVAPQRYRAAGMSRAGVVQLVRDQERLRMGRPDYPWGDKAVNEMVDACNGKRTMADVVGAIEALAP